ADCPVEIRRGPLTLPSPVGDDRMTSAELLAAWEKAAEIIRDAIGEDPALASVLITYAAMCEHDLRASLGMPGARDDIAVKVALDELSGRFSDRVASADLPPLRVTVEQW